MNNKNDKSNKKNEIFKNQRELKASKEIYLNSFPPPKIPRPNIKIVGQGGGGDSSKKK